MAMGHREVMKGCGDEWDAFTGWRRYLHWQPGQLRRVKQRFNRRVRRKVKQELRYEPTN